MKVCVDHLVHCESSRPRNFKARKQHLHDKINTRRKDDGHAAVDPIEDNHCVFEPRAGKVYPVLGDVEKDCSKTNDRSGYKQALGGMKETGSEGGRVKVEAEADHNNIEDEKCNI